MSNLFMNINEMKNILQKLINLYGIEKVDIGALEPFTHPNIIELMKTLENLNLKYAVTTNGSLFHKYIDDVAKLNNLLKVRISFYTLEEEYFNKMSNSNHFRDVFKSIMKAKEKNINIELNCLVLKNYEKHMLDIIDFALENQFQLKIYNLYYMPPYKEMFEKYFVSSEEIIKVIKSHYKNVSLNVKEFKDKRNRTILQIDNLELIIKEDRNLNRDNKFCKKCKFKEDCKEEFAEYLRIDPDFTFYPCYLRKDLKFDLKDEKVIKNLKDLNSSINVRLIVSRLCNFKCSFLEGKMWCLKQGGNYKWKN